MSQLVSLNPEEMEPRDAYRLFLSIVAPRPIAWVSTVSKDGRLNLAPFSFYTGVSSKPLTALISVGARRGNLKDTLRNAQETGEFVINVVNEDLAPAMNLTSGEWPADIDEFAIAHLTPQPSVDVKPPRVAESPISLEAKVSQVVPVEGTSSTLIIGRILRIHLRNDLLRDNGLVDPLLLRPITRLGGDEYGTVGRVFSMPHPSL